MSISEAFLRAVCARFRPQPGVAHLSLSANRDLCTKCLWGCAYSQAMKRARDDALSQWTMLPRFISTVAPAFRVDPTALQHALLRSLPTFDLLRSKVTEALARERSPLVISGMDGVDRDLVTLVCLQEIRAWIGADQKLGFLRAHGLCGREGLMWDEVLQVPVASEPDDSNDSLRSMVRAALRSDFDSLGFIAVRSHQIAAEMGELISGARHAFLVVENDLLAAKALESAGYSQGFASVPVPLQGGTINCHLKSPGSY